MLYIISSIGLSLKLGGKISRSLLNLLTNLDNLGQRRLKAFKSKFASRCPETLVLMLRLLIIYFA